MNGFDFLPPQKSERPYTVAEINDGIAAILETGNTLVWVEGEISNWKPTSSGHCYFRMKDECSQIPAVMWKSNTPQLAFVPEDGVAVMAIASIRVYQKGGYYQLDVHKMQPLGSGALHIAFEKLKAKLEKEGLFDPSFKKPLPESVRTIGVITSKQGAAIRDIIRVVASRAPQTEVVLIDVPVQGEKAASEIAAAIRRMNEYKQVECIIVGRGGGSIEDLWAFNEEIVARAIFSSDIPIISAVGHEIDFTISDFVADIRAATPSVAAEIAVADTRESKRYYDSCIGRLSFGFQRYFQQITQDYRRAAASSAFRLPVRRLIDYYQQIDDCELRCSKNIEIIMQQALSRFRNAGARLHALSPLAVLARGYAVVRTENGASVKSSDQLSVGSVVQMRFSEGCANAAITSIDTNGENTAAS